MELNDLQSRAHLLLDTVAARAGQRAEAVDWLERPVHLDASPVLTYLGLEGPYRARGAVQRGCGEHVQSETRDAARQLNFTDVLGGDLNPDRIADFGRQRARRARSVT